MGVEVVRVILARDGGDLDRTPKSGCTVRASRAPRALEPDETSVHLSEVYLFGVTEDAVGVTNRKFTRREFLLYEAVMDGNRVGEATVVVERFAAEHPDTDLGERFTWGEWVAAKAEV